MDPDGDLGPFVTPDELLSARIDGSEVIDRKMTALAAHRSQVQEDGFFFSGAESGHAFWAEEFFRLAKGAQGETGEDGLESDLFAGT
jgi:N-acetyl-1-D-myo-inositol-2-amino-2-deoxy-alpha-D-glucopyranoside deacetylase